MKRGLIWFALIGIFLFLSINNMTPIIEEKLKDDYYQLLLTVDKLFNDHSKINGHYYNDTYSSKSEIYSLLSEQVTGVGVEKIFDSLFIEEEELVVFNRPYQEYLSDTYNFSEKRSSVSYYEAVQNSLLNPALRLIPFKQLDTNVVDDVVIVKGENIKVTFYEDDDLISEHHQYARYGYPPSDILNVKFYFKYKNNRYVLDGFEISSQSM